MTRQTNAIHQAQTRQRPRSVSLRASWAVRAEYRERNEKIGREFSTDLALTPWMVNRQANSALLLQLRTDKPFCFIKEFMILMSKTKDPETQGYPIQTHSFNTSENPWVEKWLDRRIGLFNPTNK